MQERAGLEVKYLAYTSLNALKSAISKKQVVLITSEKSQPASANTASMFLHTLFSLLYDTACNNGTSFRIEWNLTRSE